MHDVLFPATYAGVIGQTLGVLAVTIAVVLLVRRERALVTLVIGVSLVLIGFFGVRGARWSLTRRPTPRS